MPRFKVYLMGPLTESGVEAEDENEAIEQCAARLMEKGGVNEEGGPYVWHVVQQEDEPTEVGA